MKTEADDFEYSPGSNSNKPLTCFCCGFITSSAFEYQNHTVMHMLSSHGMDKTLPDKPGHVAYSAGAAVKQKNQESLPEQTLGLKRPMESFTNQDNIVQPKKKRKEVEKEEKSSHKCPFSCGYRGARKDLLIAHLKNKHGAHNQSDSEQFKRNDNTLPKVQQVKPLEKFPRQQGKQVKTSPRMEENKYKCGMCHYAGAKKENLKGHMQRKHGATNKKSERKRKDEQNMAIFSDGNGMAIQVNFSKCQTPNQKDGSPRKGKPQGCRNTTSVKKIPHPPSPGKKKDTLSTPVEKTFKCEKCNYTGAKQINLARHIKKMHEK